MLKQNSRLLVVLMLVSILISGCSQSDESSTSATATGGEMVNGHTLPPEPDPDVNNATLLGVDANENGVRDDVERWIFKTYEHPIVQAVAMQNARAFQIILADPSKARETRKLTSESINCQIYYQYDSNKSILPKERSLHKESRPIILNTRERNRAYYEYNQVLSGGVYSSGDMDKYKESCDFNETKIEMGEWK